MAALLGVAFAADAAPPAQTASGSALRCGWFENPTPGNAWLNDRDAQWIVGAQGGHQAEGDWPAFAPRRWVVTNRSYGHGCACLRVLADPRTHEIQRIVSATSRPLSACRRDPALKEPKASP